MENIFWFSLFGIWYAYFGYPLLLFILTRKRETVELPESDEYYPSVTIIIPAYNEQNVISRKIDNTLDLDYPDELMEVLIISDGSTDNTEKIVTEKLTPPVQLFNLSSRGGKAAALNFGLTRASHEILVFTDASIMLEKNGLRNIVKKFQDTTIGCISGEDHIAGFNGEGMYGKYELFLRNQESKLHSIVGASGSFYAQRRELSEPFMEGLAPDFLSVLHTVEKGYRAVTEPSAYGTMSAVKDNRDEFGRKVRTLIRGMAALFHKKQLLNPWRFPLFSFELFSHKIMRWLVPFFLVIVFISNMMLFDQSFYLLFFIGQVIFYSLAFFEATHTGPLRFGVIGKISLYFAMVNVAIIVAWWKYIRGVRQEIWAPSKR